MKKIFLLLLTLLLIPNIIFAQNRIEILVNESIQNVTNEAIRVKNPNDIVEIRIYFDKKNDAINLIDKIEVKGCKYLKIGAFEQRSDRNHITNTYIPTLKSNYYFFKLKVNKISNCRGDYFNLTLLFKGNSSIKTFIGFQDTFKFYLVE